MRVSFALVVWGESYVQDFLDVSLPTLLADGNLADTRGIENSRFQLLTTPRDLARLEVSPLFQRLKRTLPVEFIDISRIRGRDKYHAASRCQVEALRLSEDYDAIALLYPDIIWSRGAIRFAVDRLSQGALALFSPAPAVLPEPAMAALAAAANATEPANARAIAIEPNQLAAIALRHYHPMWDGFDWDGDCFTDFTSCLRWNVADQGWLIRCFHLHPVMMRVQRENPNFFGEFATSLDGEYVARLFEGLDRLSFATDTNDFAIVTLRGGEMPPFPQPGGRSSAAAVARWAEAHALLLHRAFAKVAFRWHGGNIDEAVWRTADARSQAIIAEVRDRLQTPDSIIRVEDPEAYRARRARRRMGPKWGPPRIALPPSRVARTRAQLAGTLARNAMNGLAWRLVTILKNSPLGSWLRQYPAVVRLWTQTRERLRPKSEIDAALSLRNIIRNIVHRDAGDASK